MNLFALRIALVSEPHRTLFHNSEWILDITAQVRRSKHVLKIRIDRLQHNRFLFWSLQEIVIVERGQHLLLGLFSLLSLVKLRPLGLVFAF